MDNLGPHAQKTFCLSSSVVPGSFNFFSLHPRSAFKIEGHFKGLQHCVFARQDYYLAIVALLKSFLSELGSGRRQAA